METKFKIGDRVRIDKGNNVGKELDGLEGEVVDIDLFFKQQPCIYVRLSHSITVWCYPDLGREFDVRIINNKQTVETTNNNIQMKYFKTKEMSVVKKSDNETTTVPRSITVCVTVDGSNVNTGYAVRRMDDEPNVELAKRISFGRANNTKTNLTKGMLITPQLTEKYILAAIANKVLADIENGTIVIKGIR